ncbi:hypothetical protein SK3146_02019 [Paenibacillus konkukensis]|uniref:Uncharacterized protein n=1 Tax=Paenibacillus konkukensis TaxID=2020716 RepID=A0ABY4RN38_9BACL|nr:hypothetical protein [Paenibacillus konkukensis]UQZ82859.1 hypothetical protein SK3146_02019 [Paenibacillus konkukensis]
MKVNVKKVLLIIVCAELMIWYWAQLDSIEQNGQVVYHHQTNRDTEAPQKAAVDPAEAVKKAS